MDYQLSEQRHPIKTSQITFRAKSPKSGHHVWPTSYIMHSTKTKDWWFPNKTFKICDSAFTLMTISLYQCWYILVDGVLAGFVVVVVVLECAVRLQAEIKTNEKCETAYSVYLNIKTICIFSWRLQLCFLLSRFCISVDGVFL